MKKNQNISMLITVVLLIFMILFFPSIGNDLFGTDSASSQTEVDYQEPSVQGFRTKRLMNEHYDKHGKEMGFATPEEYEEAAVKAATNPKALHKLEKEDGDDVYYVEETNEFVIVSTDGHVRTYFCPDKGIQYFNKQ